MNDRYLSTAESIKRLVAEYEKYPYLYVAFDFDNTVFDYHRVGDTFLLVESLLVRIRNHPKFRLVLFTGNEGDKLVEIVKYCESHGFKPDYVNESPVMQTRKPYYNIFLEGNIKFATRSPVTIKSAIIPI